MTEILKKVTGTEEVEKAEEVTEEEATEEESGVKLKVSACVLNF